LKGAQELIEGLKPEQFGEPYDQKGYRFCVVCSTYAAIKQQWVVVESLQRMEADLKTLSKKIGKALNEKEKALKSLMNKTWHCEADALFPTKRVNPLLVLPYVGFFSAFSLFI
jgi:transposase